jgi:hypothetical protein
MRATCPAHPTVTTLLCVGTVMYERTEDNTHSYSHHRMDVRFQMRVHSVSVVPPEDRH